MSEELEYLLDKFKTSLNDELDEYKALKDKLLKDDVIRDNIEKLHLLNKYDPEYMEIKKELFLNDDYKRFLELENQILFFTINISNKLKSLTSFGGGSCESHKW